MPVVESVHFLISRWSCRAVTCGPGIASACQQPVSICCVAHLAPLQSLYNVVWGESLLAGPMRDPAESSTLQHACHCVTNESGPAVPANDKVAGTIWQFKLPGLQFRIESAAGKSTVRTVAMGRQPAGIATSYAASFCAGSEHLSRLCCCRLHVICTHLNTDCDHMLSTLHHKYATIARVHYVQAGTKHHQK